MNASLNHNIEFKKPDMKENMLYVIPFINYSRKCKLIYSGRKQISGYLGIGMEERWIAKGHEDILGGDENVMYLNWWWWFHRCLHLAKFIKLYLSSMCNLLYTNYTTIKLFRNFKSRKKYIFYPRY